MKNQSPCREEVVTEVRGWLHVKGLVKEVNIERMLKTRFPTVGEGSTNIEREKTRMNFVMLYWN